jgi:hypothetical protein
VGGGAGGGVALAAGFFSASGASAVAGTGIGTPVAGVLPVLPAASFLGKRRDKMLIESLLSVQARTPAG